MATLTMATATRRSHDNRHVDGMPLTTWLHSQNVRLQDWLARRHQFKTTLNELSALSDRELDDIGIVRCDIRKIAKASAAKVQAAR